MTEKIDLHSLYIDTRSVLKFNAHDIKMYCIKFT